ncbi:hypothetical protein [Methylobacterium sp. Leaf118]|uniref:hypothetical protein n=1 Tax=Methylobacterium sp. Leaf118 TaxID=2876562 RepID=UPI001E3BBC40|nr:hypothetical protein [Methylobacterium sp. Leaf118]
MRVPVLTILLALASVPAAADDAFRTRLTGYIADHGGCAGSRALVERELVAFERGRGDGDPGGLLLFGKAAAEWGGEDIRDLVAVIRACEALRARPGQSAEEGERRLAERTEPLARAMRRVIVLSSPPSAIPEPSARPGLRADALPGAGGERDAAGPHRRRLGPAFVPVDLSRAPPPAGKAGEDGRRTPLPPFPRVSAEAPPAPAPEPEEAPVAARRTAIHVAFSPEAAPEAGPAFRRAPPRAQAPDPQPCAVTRERFERLRSGMTPMEVEAVFGCRGRLDSASVIEGIGTFEVHVWSPPSRPGSVTVTFQDRRLKAKAQRGLI